MGVRFEDTGIGDFVWMLLLSMVVNSQIWLLFHLCKFCVVVVYFLMTFYVFFRNIFANRFVTWLKFGFSLLTAQKKLQGFSPMRQCKLSP
jgi:hypothetical protein